MTLLILVLYSIVTVPFVFLGLKYVYCWYRFQRSSKTDDSNLFNWPRFVWLSASHPDDVNHPWIKEDEGDIVK